jgi:putative membrane protein
MHRNSMLSGLCLSVFLAGTVIAQAATVSRVKHNRPKQDQAKQQDKQFLRAVAIADMTEAHLGEMAQSNASKAPVKDFGQTIAKDETQDYEQLTVLANKSGDTIPKGIDARRNPAIRTLMQAKGDNFDRDFLRDEIADQRRIIAVFQREAARGENADIKAWAGKVVAERQQELQKAQSLAR